jgi:hypothetical protein
MAGADAGNVAPIGSPPTAHGVLTVPSRVDATLTAMVLRSRPIRVVAVVAVVAALAAAVLVAPIGDASAGATPGRTTGSMCGTAGLRTAAVAPDVAEPGLAGLDTGRAGAAGRRYAIRKDSVAVDPAVPSNGELFVFLPGTGSYPTSYRCIVADAAYLGYDAVGLTYPNPHSVNSDCDLVSAACFGAVRQNLLDGTSEPLPPGVVALTRPDSVEGRLTSLVAYLARTPPFAAEGWARFLAGGQLVWSRTVLSGHSQGGGEAMFAGTGLPLAGIAAFSAPIEMYRPGGSSDERTWVLPTWTRQRRATPLASTTVFADTTDAEGSPAASGYDLIEQDVRAIGLRGPLDVDHACTTSGRCDYHGRTWLATTYLAGAAAHDSTVDDLVTPCDASTGHPTDAPVWAYLLEVAGRLPVRPAPPEPLRCQPGR